MNFAAQEATFGAIIHNQSFYQLLANLGMIQGPYCR